MNRSILKNPYFVAYCTHVCGAATRKVEFLLTFDEWLKIWIDSGQIDNRGTKRGKYVMARFGDQGPYAVGNVKIILHTENIREAHKGKVVSQKTKEKWAKSYEGTLPHIHTAEQKVKMSIANHVKWSPGGCFFNREHSKKMAITKRSKTNQEKAAIGAKGWATRRRNKLNDQNQV